MYLYAGSLQYACSRSSLLEAKSSQHTLCAAPHSPHHHQRVDLPCPLQVGKALLRWIRVVLEPLEQLPVVACARVGVLGSVNVRVNHPRHQELAAREGGREGGRVGSYKLHAHACAVITTQVVHASSSLLV